MALIYWCTGENNEARDCLNDALALLSIEGDLKAKAVIRLAVVEFRAARHEKALRILGNALEDLSVLKRRRDYVDLALLEYAAASFHFEQAGHRCFLGYVETILECCISESINATKHMSI